MTETIDRLCGEIFLKEQQKLLPKPVAATVKEAVDFLKECDAAVFSSQEELKRYLAEEGVDFNEDETDEILEVFLLPDGRYLYVEA